MENDLPRSSNAFEGFHDALRSIIASTHRHLWRLLKALKQKLEFSAVKKTNLFRCIISNVNKSYPVADSKVERQVKIFDDDGDAERLITNLVNVIKF